MEFLKCLKLKVSYRVFLMVTLAVDKFFFTNLIHCLSFLHLNRKIFLFEYTVFLYQNYKIAYLSI